MLIIELKALQQIHGDGIETFPDECCGFLFGKEEGEQRTVSKITVVNNAKEGDKRRRFEISPKDYMAAERFAEENKLSLLGVYHSHPNHPAIASEHDRVAAQPWFSYVIISVKENQVVDTRSWRLNEALQFEEESIQTELIYQNK